MKYICAMCVDGKEAYFSFYVMSVPAVMGAFFCKKQDTKMVSNL